LPFGSKVRVIDLKTGKSIIVRINDRGPYIGGRIIDLTVGAARELGMYHRGIARVRIEVLREIPILEKPNILSKPPPERRKKTPFAFLSANR
jgi:rare lipoprotein A